MKKILSLFIILIALQNCFSQTKNDEKNITKAVTDILKGFQNKNATLMNTYVDSEFGVGVIFKNEGNYGFVVNEEVDFSMPLGFIKKPWNIKNNFPIQWNKIPQYDSANLLWKNEGLFVETNSDIINYYAKTYFSDSAPDQPIFKINSDKKNVAYVTLAENNNATSVNAFRFVLTKNKDKWILSFIDVTEYDTE